MRGATWVEYWLDLDHTPRFTDKISTPSAQILHEARDIGGAAVAARTLWNWGVAAQLETALGDDPNAKFARRTLENDWQQVLAAIKIPDLKVENLSERAQPYRVHLCAPHTETHYAIHHRAILEHGFCDETLCIHWQQDGPHCVEWRAANFWRDGEILVLPDQSLLTAPGAVPVLAAALCRAKLEKQGVETALLWARAAIAVTLQ